MFRTEPNASPLFSRNLRVLARVQPGLVKRLARPSDESHIVGDPLHLTVHRSRYPLALSANDIDRAFDRVQGEAPVLMLFGVGLGELIRAALKRHPTAKIIAWDRDPAMIRRSLERVDVAVAIQKGRLRFAMGADLLNHLPCESQHVVFHPLFKQIYRWKPPVHRPLPDRRA